MQPITHMSTMASEGLGSLGTGKTSRSMHRPNSVITLQEAVREHPSHMTFVIARVALPHARAVYDDPRANVDESHRRSRAQWTPAPSTYSAKSAHAFRRRPSRPRSRRTYWFGSPMREIEPRNVVRVYDSPDAEYMAWVMRELARA